MRLSLERKVTDRLQVGLDYVPQADELTPRVVYRLGDEKGWYGFVGSSSTRTASEDGSQGAFALAGYRWDKVSVYAGPFVEFGGTTRALAGGSIDLGGGIALEPFYDGQFVHFAVGKSFGDTRITFARSGTGRFNFSVAFGF